MLWRDLHKIATIFDMSLPVQAMSPRYAIRLEVVTKSMGVGSGRVGGLCPYQ